MLRVRSALVRYGGAAAAFAILIGVSTGLRSLWNVSVDTTSFIILTMIAAAWYGGRGPGLMVALLFEETLDYFAGFPHVPPRFYVVVFNRLVLFVSLVLFASARRRAEMRLREQSDRLREALEREHAARGEAEAAGRLKEEFLATVSHELRTPLNAIVGWTALLMRHDVDEATRRHGLETIKRNANTQARIVGDVLDLSGIAGGRMRIAPQRVDLSAVVTESVAAVEPSIHEKGLKLDLDVDGGVAVNADPDRLRQVVWNLVSNAVKFTDDGSIKVELRRLDGDAMLRVEDTGTGIDPAFLPHLFEPFRQADGSMTRRHGGLGLGLAIARHLVELHGGSIAAANRSPKGSAFTVRLPAVEKSA